MAQKQQQQVSQGLALAAKAAGNKEEALSNMKYIKVISDSRAKI